jgi:hypothetical protein
MAKKKQHRDANDSPLVREVDRIFKRLDLPTSNDLRAVLGTIVGTLPATTLEAFDNAENNDRKRISIMFENPLSALWLGVGLRAPMVRAQLPWIVSQLRERGVGPGSRVLDVGSGCGLTASVVQVLTGCCVVGIDPQSGSASAGQWINEQLGTNVQFIEALPRELPILGLEPFDAVIAQTAVTYTQPEPCRSMERGIEAFVAAMQNSTPITEDTRALLDLAVRTGLLLACDHDQPSLWGYLAVQAGERDLVPDWASLDTNEFGLPLGPDRQLSFAFVPGTLSPDDLDALFEAIEG